MTKLRRFKLIKEYPGSVKLKDKDVIAIEVVDKGTEYWYAIEDGMKTLHYNLANYPDNWEEIEPLDVKEAQSDKIEYIDRKYTIWEKHYYKSDFSIDKFKKHLEEGTLDNVIVVDTELNYDSQTSIENPEEENPTQIAYDYDGNIVWDNKNGFTNKQ